MWHSPLLLLVYKRSRVLGVAVICTCLVGSMCAILGLSVKDTVYSVSDFSGQLHWGDSGIMYVRPWYRIPAYLVGMLGAISWLQFRVLFIASAQSHILGEQCSSL